MGVQHCERSHEGPSRHELLKPQEFEASIYQAFLDPRCGALFLDYYYAFDQDGNCTTHMQRDRVVRRKWYKWVGAMHENLPLDGRFASATFDQRPERPAFKHCTTDARSQESSKRCVEISSKQLKREQAEGEVDPRTVLDLARALMSAGALDRKS